MATARFTVAEILSEEMERLSKLPCNYEVEKQANCYVRAWFGGDLGRALREVRLYVPDNAITVVINDAALTEVKRCATIEAAYAMLRDRMGVKR